jgi:hypothetical protein
VLQFAGDLDAGKIHVQAPTAVVFLCGGQCSDISVSTPLSLRDAFLKIVDNPALRNRRLIQAADITMLSVFDEHYRDLLQFETDLAQITELIILFCESEGSLAELGAFAMVDEIAARLLVIIRDKHWNSDSFVKLGPLRSLENRHGSTAVYVLDDLDIGMRGASASEVKIDVLKDRLQEPLHSRLQKTREPTTFDPSRTGHVIKLIVGLIQEYRALTVDEIGGLLRKLNVDGSPSSIAAYLLCAEAVGWVVKKRKGSATLYFARNLPDAATLVMKEGAEMRDKARRRLLIRDHWRQTDVLRHLGISEVFGGRTQWAS